MMGEHEDVVYRDGEPVVPPGPTPEHDDHDGHTISLGAPSEVGEPLPKRPPSPEGLTPEQETRLRELAEKATPGPWGWRGQADGQVELRALHSGGLRVIAARRGEPCVVELDDESLALTYDACDACRRAYERYGRTLSDDVWEGHECEKPENLGTVWLWFMHSIRPANEFAVREQHYRSDVARVEHPDAEFTAEARGAVPALLAELDRLRDKRYCGCGDQLDARTGAKCGNCQAADWSVVAGERDRALTRAETAEAAAPHPDHLTIDISDLGRGLDPGDLIRLDNRRDGTQATLHVIAVTQPEGVRRPDGVSQEDDRG